MKLYKGRMRLQNNRHIGTVRMERICLLVVAFFATALQSDAAEEAAKLSGKALADHVNAVQSDWLADHSRVVSTKKLMDVKYARNPKHDDQLLLKVPSLTASELGAIPDAFDARKRWPWCSSIGAIRDQGDCGACFAVAAAEAMSDRVCIASNGARRPVLAAVDPLSCCGDACGLGCDGGFPIMAWKWWVAFGLVTGTDYYAAAGCRPYPIEPCGTHTYNGTVHDNPCDGPSPPTPTCVQKCQAGYPVAYTQDKHFGKSAYALPPGESAIQLEILTKGPVEALFIVYSDFMQYKKGVYYHVSGEIEGAHAVKIIGWGVESSSGIKYWLVANSWNTDWGMNGFFKIRRGTNECGIEHEVVAGLARV